MWSVPLLLPPGHYKTVATFAAAAIAQIEVWGLRVDL